MDDKESKEAIGYDSHMNRIDSIPNRLESGRSIGGRPNYFPQNGLQFANNVPAHGIRSQHISNLSFNKLHGGTLHLGNLNNVDGVFELQNSAGSKIVTMGTNGIKVTNGLGTNIVTVDSTGILVNTGSIVVKNSAGSTIIDSSGLNSISSFPSAAFTAGAGQTIVNTESDIGTTTGTIVTARSSKYLFLSNVSSDLVFSTTTGVNEVFFNLNGTNQSPSGQMGGNHGSGHNTILNSTIALSHLITLGAGTHTIKLRLKNNNAAGATILGASLVYVALGA